MRKGQRSERPEGAGTGTGTGTGRPAGGTQAARLWGRKNNTSQWIRDTATVQAVRGREARA
jgi:hypothetical protein